MNKNGKWTLIGSLFFVGLLAFVVLFFPLDATRGPVAPQAAKQVESVFVPAPTVTVYMGASNLWEKLFTEPVEMIFYLYPNGAIVGFSTYEYDRISGDINQQLEAMEKKGLKLSDVMIIVHNHFTPGSFSTPDRASITTMKKKGFRGIYGIYHTATKTFEAYKK